MERKFREVFLYPPPYLDVTLILAGLVGAGAGLQLRSMCACACGFVCLSVCLSVYLRSLVPLSSYDILLYDRTVTYELHGITISCMCVSCQLILACTTVLDYCHGFSYKQGIYISGTMHTYALTHSLVLTRTHAHMYTPSSAACCRVPQIAGATTTTTATATATAAATVILVVERLMRTCTERASELRNRWHRITDGRIDRRAMFLQRLPPAYTHTHTPSHIHTHTHPHTHTHIQETTNRGI